MGIVGLLVFVESSKYRENDAHGTFLHTGPTSEFCHKASI